MTTTKKVLIATGVTLVLGVLGIVIYKSVTKKPTDGNTQQGSGTTSSENKLNNLKLQRPIKITMGINKEKLREAIQKAQNQ
ncbi:MAG: hypothetical protein PHT69_02030 [Bacteroidales bacterium]|nr:hypothetical protein [Bacteroidales bacterium]